jgi:hypothetical protein
MLISHARMLEEVAEKANRLSDKVEKNGKLKSLLIQIEDRLKRYAQIVKDLNDGIGLVSVNLKKSVEDIIGDLRVAEKKSNGKIKVSLHWWTKELNKFVVRNKKKWIQMGIK